MSWVKIIVFVVHIDILGGHISENHIVVKLIQEPPERDGTEIK